jgi:hypothetical protein
MSDTPDDYQLIDLSTLDWDNAALYTPRPIGHLYEQDKGKTWGYGLLRVIFTDKNVRFITRQELSKFWVSEIERKAPASGAILKDGDDFYGYDVQSFKRMYAACELIDPNTLDWDHAQQYHAYRFSDNPASSDLIGPPVDVIFADKSMHWLTPRGKTEIVHGGDAIIRPNGSSAIRHLDLHSFNSEYKSADTLAMTFGPDFRDVYNQSPRII